MKERVTIGERFANSKFAQKHPRLRGLFVDTTQNVDLQNGGVIQEEMVKSHLIFGRKKQLDLTAGRIEDLPKSNKNL